MEFIIGLGNKNEIQPLTHAISNLGIWLNGKIGMFQKYLANPKNGLNLVPNCF
jgi:hypothetical protein